MTDKKNVGTVSHAKNLSSIIEKEEFLNCIEDLIFAFASRTVSSKRIHKELQCDEIKKAISLLEKHNKESVN